MNHVTNTSTEPGAEIDALLRSYFQAEMPTPWPAFQKPEQARSVPFRPKGSSTLRPRASRAVLLAASLLLLAALLLMPRPTHSLSSSMGTLPTLGEPSASPRSVLPHSSGSDSPGKLTPNVKLKSKPNGDPSFSIIE